MGKTYLITGGGGLLGNCLLQIICERNIDQVSKLKLLDIKFSDDVKESQQEACNGANISLEWFEVSVSDKEAVREATRDVNVVIHMACIIDVFQKLDPDFVWNVNVTGSLNVLDACCENGVGFLIYTSSIHVIGPKPSGEAIVDADETFPYFSPEKNDIYAKTKQECEKLILGANGRNLLPEGKSKLVTCVIRPTGLYGGNDPVLASYAKNQSKKMRLITRPGDLQSRMHVDNAAWCHALAAKNMQENSQLIGGNAYFIGDNTPQLSYGRLNEEFLSHLGHKIVKPEPFLPFWLVMVVFYVLYLLNKVLSFIGIGILQNVPTPHMIRQACSCVTVNHKKFRNHMDYKPIRSWPDARNSTRKYLSKIMEESRKND